MIQQINLLENLCGFRLFVRSNHGVKLTPAGRSLYEDAKTLIRFSEDALQKARLLAESSESTLRIGTCRFLELDRTPICCAVSKSHRLARASELSMQDLRGEVLVMPIKGVSVELDSFRNVILRDYPSAKIIDSNYYGVDTFAMCEMNSYILITQPVYEDIHPNLITIPLQTDISMPYGLVYAKEPTAATMKFINAVQKSGM